MKAALALLLVAVSASAETLPQPKPDTTIHLADYMRYGTHAALAGADFYTTRRGVELGAREDILPHAIVVSPGKLAAFEIGSVAVKSAVSVAFIKTHHRKLAETWDYGWMTFGAVGFFHNVYTINTMEARQSKLVRE